MRAFNTPKKDDGVRNVFDLSQRHIFSAKAGQIIPVACVDTVPGDKFELDLVNIARTMPLNTAAFTRMKQSFDWVFVPYRALWSRFNEFIAVHYAVKGVKGMEATETWAECQTRIQDAIKDIVNKYDEGNKKDAVICVTSGVNITGFINLAYGLSASEDKPFPMVPSCSPIGFEITKEMCNKGD